MDKLSSFALHIIIISGVWAIQNGWFAAHVSLLLGQPMNPLMVQNITAISRAQQSNKAKGVCTLLIRNSSLNSTSHFQRNADCRMVAAFLAVRQEASMDSVNDTLDINDLELSLVLKTLVST